jgi:hypothetical protein
VGIYIGAVLSHLDQKPYPYSPNPLRKIFSFSVNSRSTIPLSWFVMSTESVGDAQLTGVILFLKALKPKSRF